MGVVKPMYLYIFLTVVNISVFAGYMFIPKAHDYQQQKVTQDFLR